MKYFILILISTFSSLCGQAQQFLHLKSGVLTTAHSKALPTREVEMLEDGYVVTYHFDGAVIQSDELYSGTVIWKVDGFGMNQISGDPCTLLRNDMVAVPAGETAKVEVIDSAYIDFSYELSPARQPQIDSDNSYYTKQNVIPITPYDGLKPANIAFNSGTQSYRGQKLCQVTVSPIQYDYNNKVIRAYTSITYKVSFVSEEAHTQTSRSVSQRLNQQDCFLINNVIGGQQLMEHGAERANSVENEALDFLILSTSEYTEAVSRLAEWKKLMGFRVHAVIQDDWTSESVMSTVADAYTMYPHLYYLLIIGDHDDVPAKTSSLNKTHVTDFHYGCIDNDYIPDIYCGRLSVSNLSEANIVVDKVIGYEKTPPSMPSFYTNALHCAYFQDDNLDSYADRRFAQTSEDVLTYVKSLGKNIKRVYKTKPNVTPLYWNSGTYSNGEPIPNDLKKPGFAWNGTHNNITDSINNGVFYVLHRDHGQVTYWGDPWYSQQHISNLSNGNLLPVVFSLNCLTGKFNLDCFAETFLRHPNGGCVAIYAASEVSYSGYNDALATGMFDAIWPDPGLSIHIPNHNNSYSPTPVATYTLGQILNQGKIRLAETYGAANLYTKYTDELFHCLGDPSMRIYTETPTEFTDVSIERTDNSISVLVDEDEDIRITFYDNFSQDVQSYIGTSATLTTINPFETTICITAPNRIPYIQEPDVMYIQNKNITGIVNETHDVIKIGSNVTTQQEEGEVTTSNADITLKANKVLLDRGTNISVGSVLKTINP